VGFDSVDRTIGRLSRGAQTRVLCGSLAGFAKGAKVLKERELPRERIELRLPVRVEEIAR
jgi:hypothetical protein